MPALNAEQEKLRALRQRTSDEDGAEIEPRQPLVLSKDAVECHCEPDGARKYPRFVRADVDTQPSRSVQTRLAPETPSNTSSTSNQAEAGDHEESTITLDIRDKKYGFDAVQLRNGHSMLSQAARATSRRITKTTGVTTKDVQERIDTFPNQYKSLLDYVLPVYQNVRASPVVQ